MKSQTSKQLSDLEVVSEGNGQPCLVICRETVRCSIQCCAEGLRAIVLTGSMARGEGTFIENGGGVRVMGDAEFVLVFRDRAAVPLTEQMARVRDHIENSLLAEGISCAVGLTAVPPSFLSESRPHIFAYELRTRGKVIWGEPEILGLMPIFQPADIPLEDAWRLLQNRIVEMLELSDDFESAGTLSAETHYRMVKLYLDMATSFLLFVGAYAPTFRQRAERLREITPAMANGGEPFALDDFIQEVNACTGWKLGEEAAPTILDRNSWVKSIAFARRLWRWELARLTGVGKGATDRDMFAAWMRKQSYKQRLRGWLFVMRHEGWVRSWRQWPRWLRLAWKSSPRYSIYRAASEFLFGFSDALDSGTVGDGTQFSAVLDYLPLRRDGRGQSGWREIVREISFNYYQLLVETRS